MSSSRISREDQLALCNDVKRCIALLESYADDSSIFDEALSLIKTSCTPDVAREIETNGGRYLALAEFRAKQKDFYQTIIERAISDLPYKEWILKLISQHHKNIHAEARQYIIATIIVDKLMVDATFKNAFSTDQYFLPFFKNDFFNKLKNEICDRDENNDLIEVCEKVSKFTYDEKTVRDELINAYGFKEPLSTEQQDIITIALYLSDHNAVMTALIRLDAEIATRVTSHDSRYDAHSRLFRGYVAGSHYSHHKQLFGYFNAWAITNDFGPLVNLKAALIEPELKSLLSEGKLFKDAVFQGKLHGDEGHLVQWWLIDDYHKNIHPLNTKPVDLLKWIGNQSSMDIWNYTFEGPLTTSIYKPAQDARSVFDLHSFIYQVRNQHLFPVLNQLVAGRTYKPKYTGFGVSNTTSDKKIMPWNPCSKKTTASVDVPPVLQTEKKSRNGM